MDELVIFGDGELRGHSTALIVASLKGYVGVVTGLLAAGVDKVKGDSFGRIPLVEAAHVIASAKSVGRREGLGNVGFVYVQICILLTHSTTFDRLTTTSHRTLQMKYHRRHFRPI